MIPTPEDVPSAATLDPYVDAAATVQGLTIAPDWRPGIVTHLAAIKAAAELVLAFPLDDEVEAAPIFAP